MRWSILVAPSLIAPAMDFSHFTDCPGTDQLDNAAVVWPRVSFVTHLRGQLGTSNSLGHLAGLVDAVSQRFFAKHVLAGEQGRDGYRAMKIVVQAHINRFYIVCRPRDVAYKYTRRRTALWIVGKK